MNMINELPTWTVSEVNRYVKQMFDAEPMMQSLMISGEISNFSDHYRTGHLYFSLKDENAAIKAVMFSRQASRLKFRPENGMKVTVLGRVSAFERDGVYQVYVDAMQPDGAGALAAAFEQMKKRLAAEGLFDEAHKKPLPRFPKRIGVITSPTGAAVQDIFNILGRRYPSAEIVFCPVSVQGPSAPAEMIRALAEFDRKRCADVIIIGRGGGSVEDLWCFNDELLARAVYSCSIPVISAVGHETDFTICDFVSDLRAPTPSAAAELAVPDINELMLTSSAMTERLYTAIENRLSSERKKLDMLLRLRDFSSPGRFFETEKVKTEKLHIRLKAAGERRIASERLRLSSSVTGLEKLNPLSVLLRGYSVVSANGIIADSIRAVEVGSLTDVYMSDGVLRCKVLEKKEKEIGKHDI